MFHFKFYFPLIFKPFSFHCYNFSLTCFYRYYSYNSFKNISFYHPFKLYFFKGNSLLPLFLKNNCFCSASSTADDLKSSLEIISDEVGSEILVPRSIRSADMAHQIFLIQPVIKWGLKKKRDTTPELLCEEAMALVKTLSEWKVIDSKKISLLSFDKKTFFNKGQLKDLCDNVKGNFFITGVFINISSLRLDQHLFLENLFNVPVFDRYSIVINIFKQHAVTKEAKLQVALAEIPYIRSRVRGIKDLQSNICESSNTIGSTETFTSMRFRLLSEHERKIRKSLENLRKNRELLRSKRKDLEFPVIAVVGYTNSGKTSLIKCLTDEAKMKPEDKLFATLDVTVHEGRLPCNQRVLYVDTIGFITDIPTILLEPFVATLEDAIQADVIIHIQDISHPNRLIQASHVLKTLEQFNLKSNVIDNIITVGNKCDKIQVDETGIEKNIILTSCLKLTGLAELQLKVEEAVFKALNMLKIRMRVPNGGQEYWWLQKEAAVFGVHVDEKNQQYILLDVVISKVKFEKFKHNFIKK